MARERRMPSNSSRVTLRTVRTAFAVAARDVRSCGAALLCAGATRGVTEGGAAASYRRDTGANGTQRCLPRAC